MADLQVQQRWIAGWCLRRIGIQRIEWQHLQPFPEHVYKQAAFIAQEMKKAFPELVCESDKEGSDMLAIKYSLLGVYTVKAIQEQQEQIEELKETVKLLLEQNKQLQELIKNKN